MSTQAERRQKIADVLYEGDLTVFTTDSSTIRDPATKKAVTQVRTIVRQYSQVANRSAVISGLTQLVADNTTTDTGAQGVDLAGDAALGIVATKVVSDVATQNTDEAEALTATLSQKAELARVINTVLSDVAAGVDDTGKAASSQSAEAQSLAIDRVILAVEALQDDTTDQTSITPGDILTKSKEEEIISQAETDAEASVQALETMVLDAQGVSLSLFMNVGDIGDETVFADGDAFGVTTQGGDAVAGLERTVRYTPPLVADSPPGLYTARYVFRAPGFVDAVFLQTLTLTRADTLALTLRGGRFVDVLLESGAVLPAGDVGCESSAGFSVTVVTPSGETTTSQFDGGVFDVPTDIFDRRGTYTVTYDGGDSTDPPSLTQVFTADYPADFAPLAVALKPPSIVATTVGVSALVGSMNARVEDVRNDDASASYATLHTAGVDAGMRYIRARFSAYGEGTGDEWGGTALAAATGDLDIVPASDDFGSIVAPVLGLDALRRAIGETPPGDAENNAAPTFLPPGGDFAVRYPSVLAVATTDNSVLREVRPLGPEQVTHAVTVVDVGAGSYRYAIDGVVHGSNGDGSGATALELERGRTYRFDQSDPSNGTHRSIGFERPVAGGGYESYTDGVSADAGATHVVVFAVPADAPGALRYACPNHASMVGEVVVSGTAAAAATTQRGLLVRTVTLVPPTMTVVLSSDAVSVPADADFAATLASVNATVRYDGVVDATAAAPVVSRTQQAILRQALDRKTLVGFPKTCHLDFAARSKFTGTTVTTRATITVFLPSPPALHGLPQATTVLYNTDGAYTAPALTEADNVTYTGDAPVALASAGGSRVDRVLRGSPSRGLAARVAEPFVVTYTATDAFGRATTGTVAVTVRLPAPPAIADPASPTIALDTVHAIEYFDSLVQAPAVTLYGGAPVSDDETYVVTVVDDGGSNRYAIDGAVGPALALERGRTYHFDQSDPSNESHRSIEFQRLVAEGGGYESYTEGVSTAGHVVVFTVPANAPDPLVLRYVCPAHGAAMGGAIEVVDAAPSEDDLLAGLATAATAVMVPEDRAAVAASLRALAEATHAVRFRYTDALGQTTVGGGVQVVITRPEGPRMTLADGTHHDSNVALPAMTLFADATYDELALLGHAPVSALADQGNGEELRIRTSGLAALEARIRGAARADPPLSYALSYTAVDRSGQALTLTRTIDIDPSPVSTVTLTGDLAYVAELGRLDPELATALLTNRLPPPFPTATGRDRLGRALDVEVRDLGDLTDPDDTSTLADALNIPLATHLQRPYTLRYVAVDSLGVEWYADRTVTFAADPPTWDQAGTIEGLLGDLYTPPAGGVPAGLADGSYTLVLPVDASPAGTLSVALPTYTANLGEARVTRSRDALPDSPGTYAVEYVARDSRGITSSFTYTFEHVLPAAPLAGFAPAADVYVFADEQSLTLASVPVRAGEALAQTVLSGDAHAVPAGTGVADLIGLGVPEGAASRRFVVQSVVTDRFSRSATTSQTVVLRKPDPPTLVGAVDTEPTLLLLGTTDISTLAFGAPTATNRNGSAVPVSTTITRDGAEVGAFAASTAPTSGLAAIVARFGAHETGTYGVTYTAEYFGSTTSATRTLVIALPPPPPAPQGLAAGVVAVQEFTVGVAGGDSFQDPGAADVTHAGGADDAVQLTIQRDGVVVGAVDLAVVGTYRLTYRLVNAFGQTSLGSVSRVVSVLLPPGPTADWHDHDDTVDIGATLDATTSDRLTVDHGLVAAGALDVEVTARRPATFDGTTHTLLVFGSSNADAGALTAGVRGSAAKPRLFLGSRGGYGGSATELEVKRSADDQAPTKLAYAWNGAAAALATRIGDLATDAAVPASFAVADANAPATDAALGAGHVVYVSSAADYAVAQASLLGISGLVAAYDGSSFSDDTWSDLSGAGNHATELRGGGPAVSADTLNGHAVLEGTTSKGIRFPTGVLPSAYTLFHVARYNDGTEGRIFSGTSGNWVSGFVSGKAGVAYHNGWVHNGTDQHGTDWVLSTDMHNLYRSNGTTRGTSGAGSSPPRLTINHGYYAQYSDWQVAEVVVYNRELTEAEYAKVENYLSLKYGIAIGADDATAAVVAPSQLIVPTFTPFTHVVGLAGTTVPNWVAATDPLKTGLAVRAQPDEYFRINVPGDPDPSDDAMVAGDWRATGTDWNVAALLDDRLAASAYAAGVTGSTALSGEAAADWVGLKGTLAHRLDLGGRTGKVKLAVTYAATGLATGDDAVELEARAVQSTEHTDTMTEGTNWTKTNGYTGGTETWTFGATGATCTSQSHYTHEGGGLFGSFLLYTEATVEDATAVTRVVGTIKAVDDDTFGMVFMNSSDDGTHYLLYISTTYRYGGGSYILLFKRVGGTRTLIGRVPTSGDGSFGTSPYTADFITYGITSSVNPDGTADIRLDAGGAPLKLQLESDGAVVDAYTDPSPILSGRSGFFSAGNLGNVCRDFRLEITSGYTVAHRIGHSTAPGTHPQYLESTDARWSGPGDATISPSSYDAGNKKSLLLFRASVGDQVPIRFKMGGSQPGHQNSLGLSTHGTWENDNGTQVLWHLYSGHTLIQYDANWTEHEDATMLVTFAEDEWTLVTDVGGTPKTYTIAYDPTSGAYADGRFGFYVTQYVPSLRGSWSLSWGEAATTTLAVASVPSTDVVVGGIGGATAVHDAAHVVAHQDASNTDEALAAESGTLIAPSATVSRAFFRDLPKEFDVSWDGTREGEADSYQFNLFVVSNGHAAHEDFPPNLMRVWTDASQKYHVESRSVKLALTAEAGSTLDQQIPDFPHLDDFDTWTLTVDFNWNGGSGWNAIIGNMYNIGTPSDRGWGLWKSSGVHLHWGWTAASSPTTVDLTSLVVAANVNYRVIVRRTSATSLDFELLNLDDGTSAKQSTTYRDTLEGRVDIGGNWETTSETFAGTISGMTFEDGDGSGPLDAPSGRRSGIRRQNGELYAYFGDTRYLTQLVDEDYDAALYIRGSQGAGLDGFRITVPAGVATDLYVATATVEAEHGDYLRLSASGDAFAAIKDVQFKEITVDPAGTGLLSPAPRAHPYDPSLSVVDAFLGATGAAGDELVLHNAVLQYASPLPHKAGLDLAVAARNYDGGSASRTIAVVDAASGEPVGSGAVAAGAALATTTVSTTSDGDAAGYFHDMTSDDGNWTTTTPANWTFGAEGAKWADGNNNGHEEYLEYAGDTTGASEFSAEVRLGDNDSFYVWFAGTKLYMYGEGPYLRLHGTDGTYTQVSYGLNDFSTRWYAVRIRHEGGTITASIDGEDLVSRASGLDHAGRTGFLTQKMDPGPTVRNVSVGVPIPSIAAGAVLRFAAPTTGELVVLGGLDVGLTVDPATIDLPTAPDGSEQLINFDPVGDWPAGETRQLRFRYDRQTQRGEIFYRATAADAWTSLARTPASTDYVVSGSGTNYLRFGTGSYSDAATDPWGATIADYHATYRNDSGAVPGAVDSAGDSNSRFLSEQHFGLAGEGAAGGVRFSVAQTNKRLLCGLQRLDRTLADTNTANNTGLDHYLYFDSSHGRVYVYHRRASDGALGKRFEGPYYAAYDEFDIRVGSDDVVRYLHEGTEFYATTAHAPTAGEVFRCAAIFVDAGGALGSAFALDAAVANGGSRAPVPGLGVRWRSRPDAQLTQDANTGGVSVGTASRIATSLRPVRFGTGAGDIAGVRFTTDADATDAHPSSSIGIRRTHVLGSELSYLRLDYGFYLYRDSTTAQYRYRPIVRHDDDSHSKDGRHLSPNYPAVNGSDTGVFAPGDDFEVQVLATSVRLVHNDTLVLETDLLPPAYDDKWTAGDDAQFTGEDAMRFRAKIYASHAGSAVAGCRWLAPGDLTEPVTFLTDVVSGTSLVPRPVRWITDHPDSAIERDVSATELAGTIRVYDNGMDQSYASIEDAISNMTEGHFAAWERDTGEFYLLKPGDNHEWGAGVPNPTVAKVYSLVRGAATGGVQLVRQYHQALGEHMTRLEGTVFTATLPHDVASTQIMVVGLVAVGGQLYGHYNNVDYGFYVPKGSVDELRIYERDHAYAASSSQAAFTGTPVRSISTRVTGSVAAGYTPSWDRPLSLSIATAPDGSVSYYIDGFKIYESGRASAGLWYRPIFISLGNSGNTRLASATWSASVPEPITTTGTAAVGDVVWRFTAGAATPASGDATGVEITTTSTARIAASLPIDLARHWVTFVAGTSNKNGAIGLKRIDRGTNQSTWETCLDAGLYLKSSGSFMVYEMADAASANQDINAAAVSAAGFLGFYAAGDRFTIRLVGSELQYLWNNLLVYTSTTALVGGRTYQAVVVGTGHSGFVVSSTEVGTYSSSELAAQSAPASKADVAARGDAVLWLSNSTYARGVLPSADGGAASTAIALTDAWRASADMETDIDASYVGGARFGRANYDNYPVVSARSAVLSSGTVGLRFVLGADLPNVSLVVGVYRRDRGMHLSNNHWVYGGVDYGIQIGRGDANGNSHRSFAVDREVFAVETKDPNSTSYNQRMDHSRGPHANTTMGYWMPGDVFEIRFRGDRIEYVHNNIVKVTTTDRLPMTGGEYRATARGVDYEAWLESATWIGEDDYAERPAVAPGDAPVWISTTGSTYVSNIRASDGGEQEDIALTEAFRAGTGVALADHVGGVRFGRYDKDDYMAISMREVVLRPSGGGGAPPAVSGIRFVLPPDLPNVSLVVGVYRRGRGMHQSNNYWTSGGVDYGIKFDPDRKMFAVETKDPDSTSYSQVMDHYRGPNANTTMGYWMPGDVFEIRFRGDRIEYVHNNIVKVTTTDRLPMVGGRYCMTGRGVDYAAWLESATWIGEDDYAERPPVAPGDAPVWISTTGSTYVSNIRASDGEQEDIALTAAFRAGTGVVLADHVGGVRFGRYDKDDYMAISMREVVLRPSGGGGAPPAVSGIRFVLPPDLPNVSLVVGVYRRGRGMHQSNNYWVSGGVDYGIQIGRGDANGNSHRSFAVDREVFAVETQDPDSTSYSQRMDHSRGPHANTTMGYWMPGDVFEIRFRGDRIEYVHNNIVKVTTTDRLPMVGGRYCMTGRGVDYEAWLESATWIGEDDYAERPPVAPGDYPVWISTTGSTYVSNVKASDGEQEDIALTAAFRAGTGVALADHVGGVRFGRYDKDDYMAISMREVVLRPSGGASPVVSGARFVLDASADHRRHLFGFYRRGRGMHQSNNYWASGGVDYGIAFDGTSRNFYVAETRHSASTSHTQQVDERKGPQSSHYGGVWAPGDVFEIRFRGDRVEYVHNTTVVVATTDQLPLVDGRYCLTARGLDTAGTLPEVVWLGEADYVPQRAHPARGEHPLWRSFHPPSAHAVDTSGAELVLSRAFLDGTDATAATVATHTGGCMVSQGRGYFVTSLRGSVLRPAAGVAASADDVVGGRFVVRDTNRYMLVGISRRSRGIYHHNLVNGKFDAGFYLKSDQSIEINDIGTGTDPNASFNTRTYGGYPKYGAGDTLEVYYRRSTDTIRWVHNSVLVYETSAGGPPPVVEGEPYVLVVACGEQTAETGLDESGWIGEGDVVIRSVPTVSDPILWKGRNLTRDVATGAYAATTTGTNYAGSSLTLDLSAASGDATAGIEFTYDAGDDFYIGLHQTTASMTTHEMRYCFQFASGGTVYARETSSKPTSTTYAKGDRFGIYRVGDVVRFVKNDATVHEATTIDAGSYIAFIRTHGDLDAGVSACRWSTVNPFTFTGAFAGGGQHLTVGRSNAGAFALPATVLADEFADKAIVIDIRDEHGFAVVAEGGIDAIVGTYTVTYSTSPPTGRRTKRVHVVEPELVELTALGCVALYDPSSYDGSVGVWTNRLRDTNDVAPAPAAAGVDATTEPRFPYVAGGTGDALAFPGSLLGPDYTLVHLAKYDNDNVPAAREMAVTVAPKTAANPRYGNGNGSANAYFIDGKEAPTLILEAGTQYRFVQPTADYADPPPKHPIGFYVDEGRVTTWGGGRSFFYRDLTSNPDDDEWSISGGTWTFSAAGLKKSNGDNSGSYQYVTLGASVMPTLDPADAMVCRVEANPGDDDWLSLRAFGVTVEARYETNELTVTGTDLTATVGTVAIQGTHVTWHEIRIAYDGAGGFVVSIGGNQVATATRATQTSAQMNEPVRFGNKYMDPGSGFRDLFVGPEDVRTGGGYVVTVEGDNTVTTLLAPPTATTIWYQCGEHAYMGGSVSVLATLDRGRVFEGTNIEWYSGFDSEGNRGVAFHNAELNDANRYDPTDPTRDWFLSFDARNRYRSVVLDSNGVVAGTDFTSTTTSASAADPAPLRLNASGESDWGVGAVLVFDRALDAAGEAVVVEYVRKHVFKDPPTITLASPSIALSEADYATFSPSAATAADKDGVPVTVSSPVYNLIADSTYDIIVAAPAVAGAHSYGSSEGSHSAINLELGAKLFQHGATGVANWHSAYAGATVKIYADGVNTVFANNTFTFSNTPVDLALAGDTYLGLSTQVWVNDNQSYWEAVGLDWGQVRDVNGDVLDTAATWAQVPPFEFHFAFPDRTIYTIRLDSSQTTHDTSNIWYNNGDPNHRNWALEETTARVAHEYQDFLPTTRVPQTFDVVYEATDGVGRKTTHIHGMVVYDDTTAPTLTVSPPTVYVTQGSGAYVDPPGLAATKYTAGDYNPLVTAITPAIDTSVAGVQLIAYRLQPPSSAFPKALYAYREVVVTSAAIPLAYWPLSSSPPLERVSGEAPTDLGTVDLSTGKALFTATGGERLVYSNTLGSAILSRITNETGMTISWKGSHSNSHPVGDGWSELFSIGQTSGYARIQLNHRHLDNNDGFTVAIGERGRDWNNSYVSWFHKHNWSDAAADASEDYLYVVHFDTANMTMTMAIHSLVAPYAMVAEATSIQSPSGFTWQGDNTLDATIRDVRIGAHYDYDSRSAYKGAVYDLRVYNSIVPVSHLATADELYAWPALPTITLADTKSMFSQSEIASFTASAATALDSDSNSLAMVVSYIEPEHAAGDLASSVVPEAVSATVPTFPSFVVRYEATDGLGRDVVVNHPIVVYDATPDAPTIEFEGGDTVNTLVDQPFVEPAVTASKYSPGDMTVLLSSTIRRPSVEIDLSSKITTAYMCERFLASSSEADHGPLSGRLFTANNSSILFQHNMTGAAASSPYTSVDQRYGLAGDVSHEKRADPAMIGNTIGLVGGGTVAVAGAWIRVDLDQAYDVGQFTTTFSNTGSYFSHARVFGRAQIEAAPGTHGFSSGDTYRHWPYKSGTANGTEWTELTGGTELPLASTSDAFFAWPHPSGDYDVAVAEMAAERNVINLATSMPVRSLLFVFTRVRHTDIMQAPATPTLDCLRLYEGGGVVPTVDTTTTGDVFAITHAVTYPDGTVAATRTRTVRITNTPVITWTRPHSHANEPIVTTNAETGFMSVTVTSSRNGPVRERIAVSEQEFTWQELASHLLEAGSNGSWGNIQKFGFITTESMIDWGDHQSHPKGAFFWQTTGGSYSEGQAQHCTFPGSITQVGANTQDLHNRVGQRYNNRAYRLAIRISGNTVEYLIRNLEFNPDADWTVHTTTTATEVDQTKTYRLVYENTVNTTLYGIRLSVF